MDAVLDLPVEGVEGDVVRDESTGRLAVAGQERVRGAGNRLFYQGEQLDDLSVDAPRDLAGIGRGHHRAVRCAT